MRVGVLALQGAFARHVAALTELGAEVDEETAHCTGPEDRQVEHLHALEQADGAAERGDVHAQPGHTIDCISV